MATLEDVHIVVSSTLHRHFALKPVSLKHPFPERPARALGLVTMDGDVFSTDRLLRIVLLRMRLPLYLRVYSTFIRPMLEYDLPVLSCEVVITGKKRMLLLDIHRTGTPEYPEDAPFFEKLAEIRNDYSDLLQHSTKKMTEDIKSVFSRAVCQVRITDALADLALDLVERYLNAYAELVSSTAPLEGDSLEKARAGFDCYLKTIIDHDPGVKGNKILFGKTGGVERALDVFYGL